MTDPYQDAYLDHQARKAEVLRGLLAARHSERVFADRPVADAELALVTEAVDRAPSSCARHAVTARVVTGRDELALLGGLLVGGVGWIHRAPAVLLLVADPAAYKAGREIEWMPYLDAGVIAGQIGLAAAAAGLRGCFVNPNIREINRAHYTAVFGPGLLCGAFAIGHPAAGSPPEWVMETS